MREEKKKKENIIYVAIGILTLIVATAGATYYNKWRYGYNYI